MKRNKLKKKIAWLKHQLMLDTLTGAWNRRYLFNCLDLDEYQNGYLYFIDLDDFGNINKSIGHLEADQLLVKFVSDIKRSLDDGAVIRYGGDEFIVIVKSPLSLLSDLKFTSGGVVIVGNDLVGLLKEANRSMLAAKQLKIGGVAGG